MSNQAPHELLFCDEVSVSLTKYVSDHMCLWFQPTSAPIKSLSVILIVPNCAPRAVVVSQFATPRALWQCVHLDYLRLPHFQEKTSGRTLLPFFPLALQGVRHGGVVQCTLELLGGAPEQHSLASNSSCDPADTDSLLRH